MMMVLIKHLLLAFHLLSVKKIQKYSHNDNFVSFLCCFISIHLIFVYSINFELYWKCLHFETISGCPLQNSYFKIISQERKHYRDPFNEKIVYYYCHTYAFRHIVC
jgi:hypothetical protein